MNCHEPTNTKEIKSFIGAINYSSNIIPMLHVRCTRFYELTSKGLKSLWNVVHKKLFEEMKNDITTKFCLYHDHLSIPRVLRTDASDRGIEDVLFYQVDWN
ncbi:hypothetical protein RF11_12218 [Thelohanellus kitauei]|uniref:Reverse transcriptase/retrotransposon-derived protein RNase H-like domain-containing protein n=1 Tax=Thelohanellus kitauei TaxID=669202 RepID=A0A0C2NI40_THEKT|nr:hypothetical protein RF11_12218 [Thelohanellus kitauei]